MNNYRTTCLAIYTLVISLAIVIGYDLKSDEATEEVMNNPPDWVSGNNEASVEYVNKRRFGQLKFGKRRFGKVKFGKRNYESVNDEWTDGQYNSAAKRPFGPRTIFGKRSPDSDFNEESRPIDGAAFSKRYSDVLDNLYLQSVLHKLNVRSDPWNKRAKILFGKRSDLLQDNTDKRYKLKFGKRSTGPILYSWQGQNADQLAGNKRAFEQQQLDALNLDNA